MTAPIRERFARLFRVDRAITILNAAARYDRNTVTYDPLLPSFPVSHNYLECAAAPVVVILLAGVLAVLGVAEHEARAVAAHDDAEMRTLLLRSTEGKET
jgi:hypothetical protein